VELKLVQATGQTPGVEQSYYRHTAETILNWTGYYSWGNADPAPWGESILAKYWDHEDLGPALRALQAAWRLLAEEESAPPLRDRQKKLIVDHEPLVQAMASKLLRNPRGQINQFHFAALVDLGQSILIQQVRRYDPSHGVTFGAFVRKRLMGAMADWLLENNHLYITFDDEGGWTAEPAQKYVRDTAERDVKPIRRRGRPRGSGRKDTQAAPHKKTAGKSGDIRGAEALERNLAVLSQYTSAEVDAALTEIRERPKVGASAERVFRARFLTDPPVTLSALARELGLDRPGVSRKAQNTFNVVITLIEAARRGKNNTP
jgi:hypothetical protein